MEITEMWRLTFEYWQAHIQNIASSNQGFCRVGERGGGFSSTSLTSAYAGRICRGSA
jgi:hypothetical protein